MTKASSLRKQKINDISYKINEISYKINVCFQNLKNFYKIK